jgi:uncharacterized protein YndB with AHSA1/START domain
MTSQGTEVRVLSDSREIAAGAGTIFELIADPALQPSWDGNDNLKSAAAGQRVRGVGDVFAMTLTRTSGVRDNRVTEFEEGRLIAWMPGDAGREPAGHLWRWTLEPIDETRTLVTQTYDWTGLSPESPAPRLERARSMTTDNLRASLDRPRRPDDLARSPSRQRASGPLAASPVGSGSSGAAETVVATVAAARATSRRPQDGGIFLSILTTFSPCYRF